MTAEVDTNLEAWGLLKVFIIKLYILYKSLSYKKYSHHIVVVIKF